MAIEWFESDKGIPVPVEGGKILEELFLFMLHMAETPSKRGKKRRSQTLENTKWNMKIWFDFLSDQKLNFMEVTYHKLEELKEILLETDSPDRIEAQSYNIYYSTWRMFYEFCEKQGITTLMTFPVKIKSSKNRTYNKNTDLLTHTRSSTN